MVGPGYPGIGDIVRFGHGEWRVTGRSFGHRGPCPVRLDLAGYNSEFQAVRADMCELVTRGEACGRKAHPLVDFDSRTVPARRDAQPEDGDIAAGEIPAGEMPPVEIPPVEIPPAPRRNDHWIRHAEVYERKPVLRPRLLSCLGAIADRLPDQVRDRPCDSEADDAPPRSA